MILKLQKSHFLSFTCFDNFSWSLGSAEAIKMNIHYENWSKGGMTPNSKVENPAEHIQNFNWVSISNQYFNSISILNQYLNLISMLNQYFNLISLLNQYCYHL